MLSYRRHRGSITMAELSPMIIENNEIDDDDNENNSNHSADGTIVKNMQNYYVYIVTVSTKTQCPTFTHLHNTPRNIRTLPKNQLKCNCNCNVNFV